MKNKIIWACYDNDTITVYQAFNPAIAKAAVKNQTFGGGGFKKDRMTWIKPSFLWMMYRSGWAGKADQEHVLQIRIKREGFEWALQHSCLSHFDAAIHSSYESWKEQLSASPVRIQWDPEKDIHLKPLPYRSIQIGLSAQAVDLYINEWISNIEDITAFCHEVKNAISAKGAEYAQTLLPQEKPYPLPEEISRHIQADR